MNRRAIMDGFLYFCVYTFNLNTIWFWTIQSAFATQCTLYIQWNYRKKSGKHLLKCFFFNKKKNELFENVQMKNTNWKSAQVRECVRFESGRPIQFQGIIQRFDERVRSVVLFVPVSNFDCAVSATANIAIIDSCTKHTVTENNLIESKNVFFFVGFCFDVHCNSVMLSIQMSHMQSNQFNRQSIQ